MKAVCLPSILATLVLTLPAAIGADIQTDGPQVRPLVKTTAIDDATVSVQLDRGVVASGGTISSILVATADHPHEVRVDVTTEEDMGYGGERVQNPPRVVDRRTITLQAQPGGGPPVVVSTKLGSKKEKLGLMSWYDVVVARHGHEHEGDVAASVGVPTWSGNPLGLVIEPPARIPAEGPFTIALRTTNTTKTTFTSLDPSVGARVQGWDSLDHQVSFGSDDYDVELVADPTAGKPDSADYSLAPGAEDVSIFRVTPKRDGIKHFTFVAMVRADGVEAMQTAAFDRPEADPAPAPPSGSLAAR